MEIRMFNKIFIVKYQPILISFLIVAWSLYYYFSIISTPRGGAESVLFIKPLVFLIGITFLGIIYESVTVKKENASVDAKESEDLSFFDPKRLFFICSMILYAVLITFLGFIIPSIVFLFAVTFYLGVRKLWQTILIALTVPLFFTLLFKYAIKVPIPLWPM